MTVPNQEDRPLTFAYRNGVRLSSWPAFFNISSPTSYNLKVVIKLQLINLLAPELFFKF